MLALVKWREETKTADQADVAAALHELKKSPVSAEDAQLVRQMCKQFLKGLPS